MTELHVWATTRYNLEPLSALVRDNPHCGTNEIKKVICHRRKPLNTGLFFNIHQTTLVNKKVKKIHLIIFDDLDYTRGCPEWVTKRIFRNLVSLAKNKKKIFIVCSDFLNRIEFCYESDERERIKKLKRKLDDLSDRNPCHFYYFDHEDHVDLTKYEDESPISKTDLDQVLTYLMDDLEDLPDDAL